MPATLVSPDAPSVPVGWRETVAAAAALTLVVAITLHEQIADFYGVPDLGDPLFSMWRLAWIAHQLSTDPRHLFDANIFHPELRTLAYSDSMLLPAFTAAPLLWAGVPLPVAYTLLLGSGFVLSGLAVYLLARALSLGPGAAWIAGLIFALYPFRFEHYSHLELQMTQWMPLSLLAVLRLLATGRFRWLVCLAAVMAAQWYSSMYFGLFLTIYAAVFAVVLAAAERRGWRRLGLVSCGLALGILLALPLGLVYKSTEGVRGRRTSDVVALYSARPIDYLQPSTRSFWYRDVHIVKREPERELFTNAMPLALALAGIVPPLNATRLAVMAAGAVAFDGSLGLNGFWYPMAYENVGVFQSMRVPARFAILVGLSLSLLAGAGAARILVQMKNPAANRLVLGLLTATCTIEALPRLELRSLWRHPPPIYSALEGNASAVLLEYPIHPRADAFSENLPFMYFSTWHWTDMVNGYSGHIPASYARLAEASAGFPLGDTVADLQKRGVTHVTLQCAFWHDEPCAITMERLAADRRFRLVTSARWEGKPAQLYELLR